MIDQLPTELLPRVFDELSHRDSVKLALTCRACKATFYDSGKQQQSFLFYTKRYLLSSHRDTFFRHGKAPKEPGDVTLRAGVVLNPWVPCLLLRKALYTFFSTLYSESCVELQQNSALFVLVRP